MNIKSSNLYIAELLDFLFRQQFHHLWYLQLQNVSGQNLVGPLQLSLHQLDIPFTFLKISVGVQITANFFVSYNVSWILTWQIHMDSGQFLGTKLQFSLHHFSNPVVSLYCNVGSQIKHKFPRKNYCIETSPKWRSRVL